MLGCQEVEEPASLLGAATKLDWQVKKKPKKQKQKARLQQQRINHQDKTQEMKKPHWMLKDWRGNWRVPTREES